ncbi:MAG: TrbC/VirB2 family protein [Candidatus Micrarchaeaceae archaeon]
MNITKDAWISMKVALIICTTALVLPKIAYAQSLTPLDIITTLNYIQSLLTRIGPILSAILFIIAGLLYAIGQLFPSHQRGSFHTTAGDMIIGAIILAVLSVTANSFALASTHLLSNVTASNLT